MAQCNFVVMSIHNMTLWITLTCHLVKTPTLSRLAAAAALKGEQVGVVAIATQAQVGPPDIITPMGVEHQLCLGQLHYTRAQLIPIVIHVDHLTHTHTHT